MKAILYIAFLFIVLTGCSKHYDAQPTLSKFAVEKDKPKPPPVEPNPSRRDKNTTSTYD